MDMSGHLCPLTVHTTRGPGADVLVHPRPQEPWWQQAAWAPDPRMGEGVKCIKCTSVTPSSSVVLHRRAFTFVFTNNVLKWNGLEKKSLKFSPSKISRNFEKASNECKHCTSRCITYLLTVSKFTYEKTTNGAHWHSLIIGSIFYFLDILLQ